MPFERPSLSELQERIRADIRARLPGAQPELRRSLLGVLADIEAGGIHGLYGYLDFLATQLFPDTAESEYLQRWARIWRVPAVDPTAATGDVTFVGNDDVVIPQDTRLQAKSGSEYLTDEAVTIVGRHRVSDGRRDRRRRQPGCWHRAGTGQQPLWRRRHGNRGR